MISDNVTEHNNKIIDLEVHMKLGNDCPYLINYFGALHANVIQILLFLIQLRNSFHLIY